jgi:predicted adenylyl cyclase CyaB
MGIEIEAKMRVADHEAVRRQLREVGATRKGLTRETNRFFDGPGRRLASADQGLRLRTNTNSETGDAAHVVTFKGPRQAGKFKTREELEFATDDVDATATIFQHLGYPLELSFEKRRETWELDGCKVELDELPHLGTFVEVEGPDERIVESVRAKLGLQNEPSISEGYASMVAKHLKKAGGRELKFD